MIIENGTYSVYAHINKINGKMYVGITSMNPEERWKKGKAYKENTHFRRAIEIYGWDNFDHVVFASNLTQEEAFNTEKMLISKLDLLNPKFGYNMIEGGSAPPINKAEDHPNYGKHLSKQTRDKISASRKGQSLGPHTEETKRRISESKIGKPHPCSEKRKKKVSLRMAGENNPRAKAVMCVETGKMYKTAKEASLALGKSKNAIAAAIHTGTKVCGYTWKYV